MRLKFLLCLIENQQERDFSGQNVIQPRNNGRGQDFASSLVEEKRYENDELISVS